MTELTKEQQKAVAALDEKIGAARMRYTLAMAKVGEGLVAAERAEGLAMDLEGQKAEITGEELQPELYDKHGRRVQLQMGPAVPA